MSNLTQRDAARYIGTWLNQKGYWDLFPQDPTGLLIENRRNTRQGNRGKYGTVPFTKDARGRVIYKLEDLQYLCDNQIKPICVDLAKIREAKAAAAHAKGYTPYE